MIQLYYVQRLNAGERNIPSLVQRGLIGGFLGRLGMTVSDLGIAAKDLQIGWAVHITSDNGLLWRNASRFHMQIPHGSGIQKGMALVLIRHYPLHRQTSTPFASLQLQRQQ
jgi:hypothetical protein